MRKHDDYRTKKEKFHDFMRRNKWKIIVYSFIVALIIFLISLFISNKGGFYSVIFYPLALISFLCDVHAKFDYRRKFHFSIFLSFATILMFILGFFIEI